MRKLVTILAALALLPAVAMADDLSANLSGGGGQGFASLQTSGSSIAFGILVGGIGNPTGAQILQGNNVFINLNATFSDGVATGTATTSAENINALNANTGNFSLRVQGSGGSTQGALSNNGGTTTGGNGTLEFASGSFSVLETGGTATITVNRVGGIDGVVSVDYATANGTAIGGTDFQDATGTLTWLDGDAEPKTFDIQIFDNGMEDGDKTVNLSLGNVTGGAVIGLAAAILTIVDDEALVCNPGPTTLCLGAGGRFKAEVEYADFAGNRGDGESFDITPQDSGLFYFFDVNNIEMLLKVLDACDSEFNSFWVFFAATTNVEFTLTVTDTQTGVMREYENALGNPAAPVLDTAAFMTCP